MANRPYVDFKNKRLWKRVDYDNKYGYQCVDLIKQYADEVLKMWRIWAIGNAKDVPNGSFWKKFMKIWISLENVMQWDIIVRTVWTYWHIAIVDHVLWKKVYVLEQNWSWKNSWDGVGLNAIRVQAYNLNWFQTILRNDDIVKIFNQELSFVNEKIKEREKILKDTKEYRDSIRL